MKQRLLFFFAFTLFITSAVYSEVYIGGGSSFSFTSDEEKPVQPELFLDGGFSLFHPFDKKWSLFLDGGGRFSYFPIDSRISGKASVTGDVSLRSGDFFTKLQFGSYMEHADWLENPYWYQHAELYLSLDLDSVSLFAAPQGIWEIEDTEHTAGIEGRIGSSFDLSTVILTPELHTGLHFLPDNGMQGFYGILLDFSWYPGAPLTLSNSLGVKRNDSTATEELTGGSTLEVDDYTTTFFKPKASFFLSKFLTMEILTPVELTVYDHGYIDDTQVMEDNQIAFYFAPEINVTIDTASPVSFLISGGLELLHSNSSYLNDISGSVTVSADVSF